MPGVLARIIVALALICAGLGLVPAPQASAVQAPVELQFACAKKDGGRLRLVSGPGKCTRKERFVQVKPGPVLLCITKDSGTVRTVSSFRKCSRHKLKMTLPPTSGAINFCARVKDGRLRYVTRPGRCRVTEVPVQATPNDTAPTVTSTTPGNGAARVSTTADVVVNFSEPVSAGPNPITVACGGSPVSGAVSGSGTSTLTFDPASDLPQGSSCQVTVVASAIRDTDVLDPPDTMAANHVVTFATDAAPQLSSSTPADGATDVAVGVHVSLVFSEPVTVSAASFTFACAGSPVAFTLAGSGTATITLTPTADLPGAASCSVTVVAAQVSDSDAGDPPDTMAADATVAFTTADAAPVVASTTPADGATTVDRVDNIVITFDEPVTAADSAFGLVCGTTPVTVAVSGSPGTAITLNPASDLPAGAVCTVTVTAAGVTDVDAIDPPDQLAADHSFSFTVSPNSAPTDLDLTGPAAFDEDVAVGTSVGTLVTTDPDSPGDTFTYSLVSGAGDTDNALFSISGDQLKTAAALDFESKPSLSVRVRTEDSAGNAFSRSFTITVRDVNEPPTNITLSASTIAENGLPGDEVGQLGAIDPDAGQTHTFALLTSGCGGSHPDSAAFTVSGTALKAAASFNFEVKNSYSICVRATDDGTPGLTFDKAFTITITDVNDPPTAGPDTYSGAIGNTLAARGTTPSGPFVALTGDLLKANDSDEDGDPITVQAGTVATTGGGSATVNADGSFTYLPGVGDKSQNDSFTYTVSDGTATATGTVTIAIGADLVWYVDNTAAAGGDGRSSTPLQALTTLNGAGGAGDVDGTGETIFVYAGSGSYAGGLRLEGSEKLLGQKAGLVVGATTLVAPGSTAPVITNSGGNGLELADAVAVQGIDITNASGDGISGTGTASATIGTTTAVNVTGAGQDGVDLTGGSGAITIAAGVSGSTARSVNVSGRTGGTTTFSGAISGPGITLSTNTGATVAFTGALTISSGSASAFSATGGGTVTATATGSTLASTTGSTLVVENTTIGASGLSFRSVSANGAANGVRLTNTGSSGGLTVTGGGSTTRGGDASGGTITNTTGAGVLLTSTRNVSLNNLTVSNTATSAGISGTGVSGFAFTNGTVTNSGQTSKALRDSSIAFNADGATVNNVDGAVTVTNSVLSNAYQHGVDVLNNAGTISALNLSNNDITSSTSGTASAGSGLRVLLGGSAGTVANVSGGSLNGNTIRNFPNGAGIALYGGNITSAGASAATIGTSGSHVTVNNNTIAGQSTANRLGTNCVLVAMAGKGSGFIDLQNNGTSSALANMTGNCLSINATGAFQLTSTVSGNVINGAGQLSGASGIAGGADKQTLADTSTADSAQLNVTVTGNNVSQTGSHGIFFLANATGTLRTAIENNTVSGPTGGGGGFGIRVVSGTGSTSAINTTVCARIQNNTAAGGLNTGTGLTAEAIGLRKQGTVAATNTFGIVGLSPSPATAAQTVTHVTGLNPASTAGSSGAKVLVQSGDNFTSCTLP